MSDIEIKSRIIEIWHSFRKLPLWVQLWMVLWLIPINIASLIFIQESNGFLIAILANIAMLLNVPIMWFERGMSRAMALPHLPFWSILVIVILLINPDTSTSYGKYLWLLALTNFLSLVFDINDAIKWFKSNRN